MSRLPRPLLFAALAASAFLASSAAAQPEVVDAGADASVDASVGDGGVDAGADAGPARPRIDLTGPQAMVRSFVVTMQLASDERPELIDDAVRCLDVSWIEGSANAEPRSRELAARLFETLADLDIVLDDLPTESDARTVVLRTVPSPTDDEALSLSVSSRDDEWRFDEESLRNLGALRQAIEGRDEARDTDHHVQAALRSPRATMRTFLEAMDAEPPDLDRAADCLEPLPDAGAAWPVLKHDYAYRLYSILLRVRAPVLSTIPEHPESDVYPWYVHQHGRITLLRIDGDDPEAGVWHGEWRFSRSTLMSAEALYESHAYSPVLPEVEELGYQEHLSRGLAMERTIPATLRAEALGLEVWKWVGLVFLLLLLLLVFGLGELGGRLFYAPVGRIWHIETDAEDIARMSRAFGLLVMFYTAYRFVEANTLLLPAEPLAFLYPFSRVMVFVAASLFCLRILQIAEDHYGRSERVARVRVANLLLPILESFFRLLIGAALIAFALGMLGFSKAAVLGGLGLLGAAVGLAARDSIANAVAAISIVYDRPFRVGDWVNLDGVDATVERLGLVSVRLRTFYNSLVVVPNAQIVTRTVDNYGERRYRRLRHFLRLRYDTPAAKIDALCEGLRELVRLSPYTRKDYYHIYLNELTPSSANVMLYIFFDVPDWPTELRERHRFLLDSLALVEELGIELAYPTQRLLVEDVEPRSEADEEPPPPPSSPMDHGRRRAKRLFDRLYGNPPKERGPVVMEQSPLTAGFDDDGDDGDGDGDGDGD